MEAEQRRRPRRHGVLDGSCSALWVMVIMGCFLPECGAKSTAEPRLTVCFYIFSLSVRLHRVSPKRRNYGLNRMSGKEASSSVSQPRLSLAEAAAEI